MGGVCSMHGREEQRREEKKETSRKEATLKNLVVDWRIVIQTDLQKIGWGKRSGFIWLRVETNRRLL